MAFNARVTTAQMADEMVNDFYVHANLDVHRQRHNKRIQKRLMQQGARECVCVCVCVYIYTYMRVCRTSLSLSLKTNFPALTLSHTHTHTQ